MRKETSLSKSQDAESSYARRQRRRAERIIAATGVYGAAFRNEVRQAVDRLPHKLPALFREAERIDERLAEIGKEIRSKMRKAGLPIGEPPLPQSRKRPASHMAEQVESILTQYEADQLDEGTSNRAELIGSILFDIGNEAHVNATDSRIAKAYVLALQENMSRLESRDEYERVRAGLEHVRELLNGCSEARYGEINTIYNPDYEAQRRTYFEEKADGEKARTFDEAYGDAERARAEIEAETSAPENDGIFALREKLARLDDLPENEAIAFKLEADIYRLERRTAIDEWPDVIGEEA